jgi:hypothetical protein
MERYGAAMRKMTVVRMRMEMMMEVITDSMATSRERSFEK